MGSHITWMLFALCAPYSRSCIGKDGLVMVSGPKHVIQIKVKWNILLCLTDTVNYIVVFYFNHMLEHDSWHLLRKLYCIGSLYALGGESFIHPLWFSLPYFMQNSQKCLSAASKWVLHLLEFLSYQFLFQYYLLIPPKYLKCLYTLSFHATWKFLCCSVYCFVSFCVLFVCKCVLYYCHWVATQLQLTNILYQ
jgi:hypothetical protein